MHKMKLYLDTNMIQGFFINQAMAFKGKKLFVMPKKLEFFIDNLDKICLVTSFYAKAEIMREMVAGYGMDKNNVEAIWNELMKLLDCEFIPEFMFNHTLVEAAGNLQLKLRTLINFQHLLMAMDQDAYMVTGDEDLIKKTRENKIYDKVLSYIELRAVIASLF